MKIWESPLTAEETGSFSSLKIAALSSVSGELYYYILEWCGRHTNQDALELYRKCGRDLGKFVECLRSQMVLEASVDQEDARAWVFLGGHEKTPDEILAAYNKFGNPYEFGIEIVSELSRSA